MSARASKSGRLPPVLHVALVASLSLHSPPAADASVVLYIPPAGQPLTESHNKVAHLSCGLGSIAVQTAYYGANYLPSHMMADGCHGVPSSCKCLCGPGHDPPAQSDASATVDISSKMIPVCDGKKVCDFAVCWKVGGASRRGDCHSASLGISIVINRGCHQNYSLDDVQAGPPASRAPSPAPSRSATPAGAASSSSRWSTAARGARVAVGETVI